MLKSLTERLAEIRQEFAKNITRTDKEIVELFDNYVPRWNDYLGQFLEIGSVVEYQGIKYRVMQTVYPIETQTPNGEGMLAIYKPYRDSATYEWLYGEYVEIGWTRTYEGVSYIAVQNPNANIYSPDLVPAIWELQTEEELA